MGVGGRGGMGGHGRLGGQKIRNHRKKIVRHFLRKIKNFNFFEFFSEDVLKTFLKGRETIRKKKRAVFEKSPKTMGIF